MKRKGNERFTWALLCAVVAMGTAASVLSGCQQPTASDLNAVTGSSNASTATTALSLTPSAAGPPDVISSVSGNAQTAVNGSQLSNQLTVRVTDVSGKPVPNVTVTFAPGIGGGLIATQASVVTDSSGFAAATVILGSTVGTQTFTATMPSGSIPSVTFTHSATAVTSLLKIFALAGANPIGTTGLVIGDSFSLRTVLVSSTGAFIKEIPATWWMTGTLAVGNLAITGGNPSKYATFTPTVLGVGTVNAIVDDATLISQNNITSTTTVTGTITVSLALTPDTLSIESGNLQTAQVGTNLAQNLVVKVVNAGNTPVPGANVTFAVASGGGQIVSAQPVATDSSGLASCVVKLGGVVGGGHSFTATMPTGTTKQVLFTATGTHAAAAQLSFYQQPGGANSGSVFSTQPILELQDQYGNRVTSDSTSTVTLSVNTGSGSLGGTLTKTLASGLATFTNVTYSLGEAGVKLTAASSIGGVTSAISGDFTVGTIIASAQCAVNGSGFNTTEGGCKDLTSGLVWSSLSASTYTWYQAAWDSSSSGSTAPEAWEVARGLTKDIVGSGVDLNAGAYCHDLVESGATDWRLPTVGEVAQAWTDGASTAVKNMASVIWTGTSNSTTLGNGYTAVGTNYPNRPMTEPLNVRCVRDPTPTKLIVTQQVDGTTYGLGVNTSFAQQPVVRVADSTNSTVAWSTVPVTLTVTGGTGQLCSTVTTTGVTSGCAASQTVNAVAGVATFANLSYSKAETVTLTASSSGLTSAALAPFTVNQTYPRALCKLAGGVWINGLGGCKDTTNGLILGTHSGNGYPVGFSMPWNDLIWDQQSVGANAGTQEASDDGRTNDYDRDYSPTRTTPDNSSVNYCHSLQESGQTDWFPLPYSQNNCTMTNAGKNISTYLNWSSTAWTSRDDGAANAYAQNTVCSGGAYVKGGTYGAVCVRRDPPAGTAFNTNPAGGANGFGSGIVWATQPVVDVRDADGAGPLSYDTSTITLTVVPASDGTGGTGKLLLYSGNKTVAEGTTYNGMTVAIGGQSVTRAASNGRASFSGLSYSKKGGEKFRLQASGTASWLGNNIALTPATTADLTVPALYSITQCNGQGGWASEYGGCHDTQGGAYAVVWSHVVSGGVTTWYDSIWDSATFGEDAADADDAGRTNDYDLVVYPPGTGVDNTTHNWCHRLNLNGYTDWRMPTWSELVYGLGSGYHNGYSALNNSGAGAATYLWSSSTFAATPANAYALGFDGYAGGTNVAKNTTFINASIQFGVRCVRPATP